MHLAQKIAKIFIYILGGFLLLLFIASFFVDPIAKSWLEQEVSEADEGQYSLQLEEVNISLLQGNIMLKGISFRTGTAGSEQAPVIMADATEFSARGVSWLTFVLEKRLLMDELKLEGLNLRLSGRPVDTTRSVQPFSLNQLDVYPQIREHIKKVHLQDLALSNIDFTLVNTLSHDTLRFSANRLDLESKDILIDADKLITEERAFYAAFIDFDGEQLQLRRTGNASWLADVDRLKVNTREDMLGVSVQALHYLQTQGDSRDTLMWVELQQFELNDLNLHTLQEEEIAEIQSIRLTDVAIIDGIDKPSAEAEENQHVLKKSDKKGPADLSSFSMGTFLPEFAPRVTLAELEVKAVSYEQKSGFVLQNAAVRAADIVLDEQSAFAEKRFLHAAMLQASSGRFRFAAEEGSHGFRWDKLQLEAEEGIAKLEISQLEAEPRVKKYNEQWVDGQIALLQLDAIDTRRLEEGELHLGNIRTEQPQIMYNMAASGSPREPANDGALAPDLYPALEGMLRVLSIKSLQVNTGNLQLSAVEGGFGRLSVPGINIYLNDIYIDRESAFAENRLLHSREIQLEMQQADYRFPDNQGSLKLGNFSLSSSARSLKLGNVHYAAHRSGNELGGESSPRLSAVNSRTIDLRGIDFRQLMMGDGLNAAGLGIHDTDILLAASTGSGETRESLPTDTIGSDEGAGTSFRIADLNLSSFMPAFMKTVKLDSINITAVNIMEEDGLKLENLWMHASSVHVNENGAFAEKQFLHAEKFKTGFDTLWAQAGDPVHYLMTRDFLFTVEDGRGRLELGDIILSPQERPGNKAWMEADIPALIIPDINTGELSAGILRLDEVMIRRPSVVAHIPSAPAEREEERKQTSPPDLFPLIEGTLSELRLGRLGIEGGEVRLAGLGGSFYGMSLHNVGMQVSDLLLAPGTAFINERILHSAAIDLSVDKLIWLFPNKVYSLQLDSLKVNSVTQSFKAVGLRYLYGENYNKVLEAPAKNDVYRLISDSFEVDGVDFRRFFTQEEFSARTVRLSGLDLYIYKDLNMPEEDRVKPMPREMVFNIEMPLSIATLEAEDFAITYEEMAEGAASAGLVTLMEVSTTITNISNIREELSQKPDMQLRANGRLMGKGYFETQMEVPLLDEHKKLRIRGSIDTLDMSRLNRISRYNSRIAIQAGTLYKANWDFEADGDFASGDFEVSYEDLRVQLSSANSPDTTGVLKDIGSYLANLIVVDSNIAASRTTEPKKVTFTEERNKKKSFFNFYVHALLTGLMEAIGVPFQ